jgi:hypothetical protein
MSVCLPQPSSLVLPAALSVNVTLLVAGFVKRSVCEDAASLLATSDLTVTVTAADDFTETLTRGDFAKLF